MNPFDELELDPRTTPQQLTDILRLRAERADDDEKQRIQSQWRALTLKESDRVKWAIFAHPRPATANADAIESLRETVPPYVVRDEKIELETDWTDELVNPESSEIELEPPKLW